MLGQRISPIGVVILSVHDGIQRPELPRIDVAGGPMPYLDVSLLLPVVHVGLGRTLANRISSERWMSHLVRGRVQT